LAAARSLGLARTERAEVMAVPEYRNLMRDEGIGIK
jgi:hypothetical protein